MRRTVSKILLFSMLFSLFSGYTAKGAEYEYAPDIKIYVNGDPVATDKDPIITNSRTLAPIRSIAEACGINVGWNSDSRSVTLSSGFLTATLAIDNSSMSVYNSVIDELKVVPLECAPMIIDSSTYITVRSALEVLGAKVDWNADTRSIHITPPKGSGSGLAIIPTVSVKDPEAETPQPSAPNTEPSAPSSPAKDNDNTATEGIGAELVPGMRYTDFRPMENDTIVRQVPHRLYGRIRTEQPITLVRCRIVGTEMDYTLFFNKEDDLRNYNVNTYFNKLMCFSAAGIGDQCFEVYAAVNDGPQQLVFSYNYTIVDTSEPVTEDAVSDNASSESPTPVTPETSDTATDTVPETQSPEVQPDAPVHDAATSSYGFRKMTNDSIVVGNTHGLYGSIVSNYPITTVRCRIAGTEMDYSVEIPEEDNITSYNIFTYFDKLMRFSRAGLGEQQFEIYAGTSVSEPRLIFSYTYTVTEEAVSTQAPDRELPAESAVGLPLEGAVQVTSPYGFRAYNKWQFHKGVDIISDSFNILAVADGTVVDCATGKNSGAGNYVAIEHEGGWVSLYYHLASYDVEIGDTVKKGEQFAIMGNTGGNYGIHLHLVTCEKWKGNLWETQNSYHRPPHEYVPQLLTDAANYTPCFEGENIDKFILYDFNFPNTLIQGSAVSITKSKPQIASENPIASYTLTITDKDGNVHMTHTAFEPTYQTSGGYLYTDISKEFDNNCKFGTLPAGEMKITLSAVTSLGRERVLFVKNFTVTEPEVPTPSVTEQSVTQETVIEQPIEQVTSDSETEAVAPEVSAEIPEPTLAE